MAFDENLAVRIRKALARKKGIEPKRTFGGLCFIQTQTDEGVDRGRTGGRGRRSYCQGVGPAAGEVREDTACEVTNRMLISTPLLLRRVPVSFLTCTSTTASLAPHS